MDKRNDDVVGDEGSRSRSSSSSSRGSRSIEARTTRERKKGKPSEQTSNGAVGEQRSNSKSKQYLAVK